VFYKYLHKVIKQEMKLFKRSQGNIGKQTLILIIFLTSVVSESFLVGKLCSSPNNSTK